MNKTVFVLILLAAAVAACVHAPPTQDSKDAQQVRDQQAQYAALQPIPYFDRSMDRDTFIQIYKAKNKAVTTWSYWHAMGTNDVPDANWCASIGFAIPADTQLTNDQTPTVVRIKTRPDLPDGDAQAYTYVEGVVSQPEPNGLYSSKNTDGTYVLCIRPDGAVEPTYTEDKVTTVAHEIKVENGKVIDLGKESSIKLDIKAGTEGAAPEPSQSPTP